MSVAALTPDATFPGDPSELFGLSRRLSALGEALDRAGEQVAQLKSVDWSGPAAAEFRAALHPQTARYAVAGEALVAAGVAIATYAAALEDAQAAAAATVAAAHPPEVAARLLAVAGDDLARAARTVVAALHDAAGRAPRRPDLFHRVAGDAWAFGAVGPVNVAIGIGKGTWSAVDATYRLGSLYQHATDPVVQVLDPGGTEKADRDLAALARSAADDPGGFLVATAKNAVAWDEWSKNPDQALGEVLPGIASAVVTDGGAEAVEGAQAVRAAEATAEVEGTLNFGAADSWLNLRTLDGHFRKHGPQFGWLSAGEYARGASNFLQSSQIDRLPTRIDSDGTIRIYDARTNTFGAYGPNGKTKTLFMPERGVKYWDDQPGLEPWSGR